MSDRWTRYYDAAGNDPRPTLRRALDGFAHEGLEGGTAVDLGCGAGRDTFALLERGWSVCAIDGEPEAIRRLLANAPRTERLRTQVATFERASWPSCDLVNSSFALPFCQPSDFPAVWARVVASLRVGGRFCGQLFGDRDGWAPSAEISFHSRDAALALFDDFDLEHFDEVEEDGATATGVPKRWHLFHVVARKRASAAR